MKTVFLGDSLTAGMPGVSYWRFLHNKSKFVNRGVGGDTLLGAATRVEKMLSNPRYNDVDQYIIEIGTNDVLLPVLQKHSFIWRMIVGIRGGFLGCVPCEDIEMFCRKYEELLQKLISQNKRIGVIGLPMIENSMQKINQNIKEYDAVIVDLCKKYKIAYLDIRQLEMKMKGDNHGAYFFGKTNLGNVVDAIFTSILPFSMQISKHRGLAVTIDGTHLNKKMAKALAVGIETTLL